MSRALTPTVWRGILSPLWDVEEKKENAVEIDEKAVAEAFGQLQTHRGGEIKSLQEDRCGRCLTQSVDARLWKWKTVVSARWRSREEHINTLEVRGCMLAYKWRARHVRFLNSRFIHLVDSIVTMGSLAKGRSSAGSLRFIVKRTNALLLASGMLPILGHVRSHLNPADKPSRFFRNPPRAKTGAGLTKRTARQPRGRPR